MSNFIHHKVTEQQEKKHEKNINKQLHNTHNKRKAMTTVKHMALYANTRVKLISPKFASILT